VSVVSSVSAMATRIANEIRDGIRPRLIPSGGTSNQVLKKNTSTNYDVAWTTPFDGAYSSLSGKPTLFDGAYASLSGKPTLGTAAARNISVGTSAPSSPATNDIWIDIT